MQEEPKKDERKVVELSVDDILPNRFQPRIKFDDSAIFELSESIKAHGVFQPIIVRPIGDKYEIIAGERRYKASVLANKKTIPAIVMNLDDNDTVEIALIENVQRANLTPIEEAISYKKILDMGYMNQEQLAQKLGKTQSTIANKMRLLNLDEEVQEALLENKISERHARSILKLKNYDDQRLMLKRILNERLTVRKTDEEIDKMNNKMDSNSNIPVVNEQSDMVPQEITDTYSTEMPYESDSSFQIFNDGNEPINPVPVTVNESTVMNSDMPKFDTKVEAPSIMNIDSIKENAQDLNEKVEVAPMDKFLEPAKFENVQNTPVEQPVTQPRPGRFFNFASPEPVEEEKIEDDISSSKNFSFDNLYSKIDNNDENVTNSFTNPDIQPANTGKFFGFTQQNEENPNVEENRIPNDMSNNSNNFSSNNNNISSNTNDDINIKEQNNDIFNDFSYSSFNKPTENTNNETKPFAFENNDVIETPTNNENIDFNETSSSISSPFGFDFSDQSTNNDSNNSKNEIIDDNVMSFPAYNEESNSYTQQNVEEIIPDENGEKNIMSAISIIREAASKIEKLGFAIDTDEIDLENMYQVILKIEK